MKVKFLTAIASANWHYGFGDTADLDKSVAESWIAAGICETVAEELVAEEPKVEVAAFRVSKRSKE